MCTVSLFLNSEETFIWAPFSFLYQLIHEWVFFCLPMAFRLIIRIWTSRNYITSGLKHIKKAKRKKNESAVHRITTRGPVTIFTFPVYRKKKLEGFSNFSNSVTEKKKYMRKLRLFLFSLVLLSWRTFYFGKLPYSVHNICHCLSRDSKRLPGFLS